MHNMNFGDHNEQPGDPFARQAAGDEPNSMDLNSMKDAGIKPSDVLCGRGKLSFNHGGNKRFRDLVAGAVEAYNAAGSRLEKACVVNEIVEKIRAAGGSFLRRDDDDGAWHSLNYTLCREKCGHGIRDVTASLEAKKKRRRQREVSRKNVADAVFGKKPSPQPQFWNKGGSTSLVHANLDRAVQHYSHRNSNQFMSEHPMSIQRQSSRGYAALTALKEDPQPEPMHATATGMWRSSVASRARRTSVEDGQRVSDSDDDNFLAYIDDCLGPLPADAEKQDILGMAMDAPEPGELQPANNMDAQAVNGGLNIPAAQVGRSRLGERLNSRWFPNVVDFPTDAKARDPPSNQRHT